uniref:Mesothelin-like protein n=1 Tax=Oncorhynchus kisutch TaxID=8019 RepID=A0A8C7CC17_ONCKI
LSSTVYSPLISSPLSLSPLTVSSSLSLSPPTVSSPLSLWPLSLSPLNSLSPLTNRLSPSVLQGFTCTSAQSMTIKTVHRLVHACRPRILREKVALKETQLTCMYNLLKDNLDQSFTDYPSDMLLYYNYAKVEKSNCRSYFNAAGSADFSVLSSVLNKDEMLLDNAKSCLGISEVSLSKNHVEVLGNMVCTMNGSYILNSDPFILEKLKNCKDFTEAQVAAMETLLISGTTQYGKTTTWNQQTLEDLETLPLYLTQNFWSLFTTVKGKFLKSFMPQLRKQETVKRKLKTLFKQINSFSRSKRGAGCITGNITQSVIADTSFPFGYDMTQFDLCLDISVLKDNLAAFTKQVDDNNFQKIILVKLNQAYPSGIVDEQLKVLGSVSRVATLDDITKWSITKIDTLSALMAFADGPWETEKSKAIITTYLNTSGNSLGSSELNAIGANLCSLDVSVLKTITSSSLKNANSLDVTSCSTEQKRAVYDISKSSFSSQRISNPTYYQLISPYLGKHTHTYTHQI